MTTAAIPAEQRRTGVHAVRRAGVIGLAATGFGLLFQLLFFDTGLGINFHWQSPPSWPWPGSRRSGRRAGHR